MRSLRYMWAGLLTDRINNKLKKSNLINEHALDREPGLAMPFFIFGDSRLFYWLAAFILIGHILLWLHSLLLQFNRTDVCLLSMTVCICWHWLYFFFVPWWIFWVSNPIRPPLFGCVLNVLCILLPGIDVVFWPHGSPFGFQWGSAIRQHYVCVA